MGYHKIYIPKGVFGEVSKVTEELLELQDAIDQGNKIMALVELSDIIGAIKGYLDKHHPDITLEDLMVMSDATERAFKDGSRR